MLASDCRSILMLSGVTQLTLAFGLLSSRAEEPQWERHVTDDSAAGPDGIRLADTNQDGWPDVATGWEQSGVVRICMHPGKAQVRKKWPGVNVGIAADVEDAVFVDLDNDGAMDVVSCSEGRTRRISVHWGPRDQKQLLNPAAWHTGKLLAADNRMMWMFAVPWQIDGRRGIDLVAGGKGASAGIGWFESPEDPRDLEKWKWHELRSAGWVMSLIPEDMDGDGDQDLVLTDRKGTASGASWLENPGIPNSKNSATHSTMWAEHSIGCEGAEAMFLDLADLDQDGLQDVVVAVRPREIHWLRRTDRFGKRWEANIIPLPAHSGTAKAVSAADIDCDGQLDLVFSCENALIPKSGVMWLSAGGDPHNGPWIPHDISGPGGTKYDLVVPVDLDGDGDLDVLTTEEVSNPGVIWFENPRRPD